MFKIITPYGGTYKESFNTREEAEFAIESYW